MRIMITAGRSVVLAEGIIDGTHVCRLLCPSTRDTFLLFIIIERLQVLYVSVLEHNQDMIELLQSTAKHSYCKY